MIPRLIYIPLVLLLGQCLVTPVYANDFQTAKQLLKDNKPEQAYKILTTKETYHMGEPSYDLLLARVALQIGKPHEAIFAYERVLINKPGHNVARVELAIAYYQINELENSRRLFNMALINNPPDDIKNNILTYIDRINVQINSRKHNLTGVLTLKQGWDSNINSATAESKIELAIGTYQLAEGDQETSDTFTEVVNRLNYNYNYNVNSRFFSSVGYTNKENNNKQFDSQMADIKAGYSYLTSIGKISIPLSYQTMWLDEKQLREVVTVGTSLNHTRDQSFSDYSLQYGEIRYPYQQTLNVDFVAASFAFGFSDPVSGFGQQYALFYGNETPTKSLYEFNAKEYWGMQILFPVQISQQHSITPKIVYQVAEYQQRHPFFITKRKDHYSSYELTWGWYITRSWNLTTQAGYTESDSSVRLYSHTRTIIYTGINFHY